jgi:uncharacterized membrane-anchored protein YhcB (DUF1043 family)
MKDRTLYVVVMLIVLVGMLLMSFTTISLKEKEKVERERDIQIRINNARQEERKKGMEDMSRLASYILYLQMREEQKK